MASQALSWLTRSVVERSTAGRFVEPRRPVVAIAPCVPGLEEHRATLEDLAEAVRQVAERVQSARGHRALARRPRDELGGDLGACDFIAAEHRVSGMARTA